MSKNITLNRKTFYMLLAGTLLSFVFIIDAVRNVAAKEAGEPDMYRSLKLFTDVLAMVQKNYVQPVKVDDLVEGALKGMLQTLDPHSGYLNEEFYKDLQVETRGEFGGLGIEITVRDGMLTVVSPIEDSPATKAGVQPGDQIIKIDKEFTKDMTLVDAVKKMRGAKGSPLTIYVHREGRSDLIPLTLIRDIIKVQSVRFRSLEKGYGYIRLAQFQEGSAKEFTAALKDLSKAAPGGNLQGLVIDLRNNPGGLLNQAVRIADIFMEDGVIVYTDGRLESQKQKYYAHNDGDEPKFPIVILVNGGSASASEIVSGAMQDAKRALILGTQTFGKGSVQTILPMEEGRALRLTTALYYTGSGRSIQAQGVTPDIIVSAKRFPSDTEETLELDESFLPKERDLPGAFKNPKGVAAPENDKPAAVAPVTPAAPKSGKKEEHLIPGSREALTADLGKLLEDDPQLQEAQKLLKSWEVFKSKLGGGGQKKEESGPPANI